MATTTNFGWETPDDTDLVKDGALAMRTLGNAIDTSLVDLKGGTTGQVLSKTSNTDMDFTWVTSDDANAIQNAIVDAKGDLIAATAADTVNRLAVGSNDQVLVADSSTSTGLAWKSVATPFAAGKNKIINGDFNIWQRGTSFTTSASEAYTADRWVQYSNGSMTTSRQTFTAGTAPVAGYEGTFFYRLTTSATNVNASLRQKIEDVRVFAGETVTLSYWIKGSGTFTATPTIRQNFGSGGSTSVDTTNGTVSVTTAWSRVTKTFTVPSISGKTIGTGSCLEVFLYVFGDTIPTSGTIDIWGVQVESGSVATAFQTATGTLQGELAACQRYFQTVASGNGIALMNGAMYTATAFFGIYPMKVTMRTAPTISQVTGTNYYRLFTATSVTDDFDGITALANGSNDQIRFEVSSGISVTAGQAAWIITNNAASFIGLQAEL